MCYSIADILLLKILVFLNTCLGWNCDTFNMNIQYECIAALLDGFIGAMYKTLEINTFSTGATLRVCESYKPLKALVQLACTMVVVKIKDLP